MPEIFEIEEPANGEQMEATMAGLAGNVCIDVVGVCTTDAKCLQDPVSVGEILQ